MSCNTQYKDATPIYLEQIDVIRRLADKYSQQMVFVTSAAGMNYLSNPISVSFVSFALLMYKVTLVEEFVEIECPK